MLAAEKGNLDYIKDFLNKALQAEKEYKKALQAEKEYKSNTADIFINEAKSDEEQLQEAKTNQALFSFKDWSKSSHFNLALEKAIENNHKEVVKYLLGMIIDHVCGTPLSLGVGKQNILQFAIQAAIQLDIQFAAQFFSTKMRGTEENILHFAAQHFSLKIIEFIFKEKIFLTELNVADKNRLTPLHYAASRGDEEIANLLLKNGAKDKRLYSAHHVVGLSALMCAAENNHLGVVKKILADKSNRQDQVSLDEALFIAVRKSNMEITNELLEAGASVSFPNKPFSPLHDACAVGNIEIVKLLLAKGADVNAIDNQGKTPLMYAAEAHAEKRQANFMRQYKNHFENCLNSNRSLDFMAPYEIRQAHLENANKKAKTRLRYTYDNLTDEEFKEYFTPKYPSVEIVKILLMHGAKKTGEEQAGNKEISEILSKNDDDLKKELKGQPASSSSTVFASNNLNAQSHAPEHTPSADQ